MKVVDYDLKVEQDGGFGSPVAKDMAPLDSVIAVVTTAEAQAAVTEVSIPRVLSQRPGGRTGLE